MGEGEGGSSSEFSQADSLLTDSLGIEGIETKNFGTLINLGNTYTYTCAQYRFSSRFGVEDSILRYFLKNRSTRKIESILPALSDVLNH